MLEHSLAFRLGRFLLGFVLGAGLADAANAAPRPNVILIMADDLGFSDLGCYGSEIHTPHLDRLAAEGLRFTQFYNCGSGAQSRVALYSGLHPRLGPAGSTRDLLHPDMVTLAEVLRTAGYETALTGKWQLGAKPPRRALDRGFGDFYGILDRFSHHFAPGTPAPDFTEDIRSGIFAHNEKSITEFPEGFYSTDAFSDHAIKLIRGWAKSKQPFFLNLCYTAPHFPLHAPAKDIARYKGKYRDGYDPMREQRFRRQIELGLFAPATVELSPASSDLLYEHEFEKWSRHDPVTRAQEEGRMEAYAGMVDHLDQGIGRVLATLDETGLAGNTVVVFLSDNGGNAHFPAAKVVINVRQEQRESVVRFNKGIPVGDGRGFEFAAPSWGWAQNTPFRRHKYWTYEGGICTPMIVRWPGVVAPGGVTKEPGHVVDFMPTLIELAGAGESPGARPRVPSTREGESLLPILRGGTARPRATPLGWELYGSRALRDGPWKLVWDAGEKVWELYDLASDRTEIHDVASHHPARVAAMAAEWLNWAQQTGAPVR